MVIGIIPVRRCQQKILVGQNQAVKSLFTTHAQLDGVFPMVESMVYGQRLLGQVYPLATIHTLALIKA